MTNQASPTPPQRSARLELMLRGPLLMTLIGFAWPNILMMLSQSSAGLIETWFISRLGTQALAGAALVVPVLMLMQNMSQGAMGGGVSSAIARALGAGQMEEANELVFQAVILNAALGLVFTAGLLWLGPTIYRAMGASGGAYEAALQYSNVLALGLVLMWVTNGLASVVRGTGNMMIPGSVIVGGTLMLFFLSPALIFGIGPIPALGMSGAGLAIVIYYGIACAILMWVCISGKTLVRLRMGRPRWLLMRRILSVGALATFNPLLTNFVIAATTTLVGMAAGVAAVAGYGSAARIELLVIPIAFGIGAPLVAIVSSNLGAGQRERALRVALLGGGMAFVLAEIMGLAAAFWPEAWMTLFTQDPQAIAAGSSFLRYTGPCMGFFGLGFALYFASQGAGKLKWPLLAGASRLLIAAGGGWLVLRGGGGLSGVFVMAAVGMPVYGLITLIAVASGAWFKSSTRHSPTPEPKPQPAR